MNKESEAAYEPMPQKLLDLIEAERQEDIRLAKIHLEKLQAVSPLQYAEWRGVDLIRPSSSAKKLCNESIGSARLRAYPSKASGRWRMETDSSEWYITHEEVVAAFKEE